MSYYSNVVLENYQVRKGKKKKTAYIEFVRVSVRSTAMM